MCKERTARVALNDRVEQRISEHVRSILKRTSKTDLLKFNFTNLENEMTERCPLLQLVLKTASTKPGKSDNVCLKSSVCTAAAVCLKNTSCRMTTLQLIISDLLQHSSYSVSIFEINIYLSLQS